jgi:DNA polymerase-3 subunit delta'
VARGGHPDVRLIERADDKRDITIEQIRQVEEWVALAPTEALAKLICIAGSDTLNAAAASALLKTLEEPPPRVTMILTAVDPRTLPITIRSRCQSLALQPVPARLLAEGLVAEHAVEPARAEELAALARGRPGWAIRALADPRLLEKERESLAIIGGLAGNGPYRRLLAVETWLGKGTFLESRERALGFCALLETWWRDALLVSQAGAAPSLRGQVVGRGEAPGCGQAEIAAFLPRIQETAARVEANVTPRLALEHLVLTMPRATGSPSGR